MIIERTQESSAAKTFPRLVNANGTLRSLLKSLRQTTGPGIVYDVAFAPHSDYHVVTAFPIAESLRRSGLRVAFLDFTRIRENEGSRTAVVRLAEKHCHDMVDFIANGHSFSLLVVFNDWDPSTTRPLVRDARASGAATVGFVEGINDFEDMDVGFRRDAYRTVEWVLGAGEDDRRYFREIGERFRVVGFPRLVTWLAQPVPALARRRAVINVNFSYGVLEDKRDAWLASAIEGCRLADLDWIVSQHPQDWAELAGYPVDLRDFEAVMRENAILISRFSSCIIEALAMGRAVVYHNPSTEKIRKFREPLGAYSVSSDAPSLANALKRELDQLDSVPDRRESFLEKHCDVSRNWDPHEKASRALKEILVAHRQKQLREKPSKVSNEIRTGVSIKAEWSKRIGGRIEASFGFSRRIIRICLHRSSRSFLIRNMASPSAATLYVGLTLLGAGIFEVAWNAWLAIPGLAFIGLAIMREALLWRWQRERDMVRIRRLLREALAVERTRSEEMLSEALAADSVLQNEYMRSRVSTPPKVGK